MVVRFTKTPDWLEFEVDPCHTDDWFGYGTVRLKLGSDHATILVCGESIKFPFQRQRSYAHVLEALSDVLRSASNYSRLNFRR